MLLGRNFVKASDSRGDGMDLATAQQCHNPVADFLQPQSSFDDRPVFPGHGNGIWITQKIGSMQHVDMQGVALNPFATIKKTAERPDGRVNTEAQSSLDGMRCAHLIRDRADSANA